MKKKKKKIGKKRDKQAQWEDQHINDRIVNICKNEYLINILRISSQIISFRKTKMCTKIKIR